MKHGAVLMAAAVQMPRPGARRDRPGLYRAAARGGARPRPRRRDPRFCRRAPRLVSGAARDRVCRRIAADRDRQDHAPRIARAAVGKEQIEVKQLADLEIRQKAEGISALFRERRQIDVAGRADAGDLDEAYGDPAGVRRDRDRRRARRRRRLQDRADDADHAKAVRRRRAGLRRDLRRRGASRPRRDCRPELLPSSGSRPKSRCGSATNLCRAAGIASASPGRSKAACRRSSCSRICAMTTSASARRRWLRQCLECRYCCSERRSPIGAGSNFRN